MRIIIFGEGGALSLYGVREVGQRGTEVNKKCHYRDKGMSCEVEDIAGEIEEV